MSEKTPEELAREGMTPKTFSFIERLQGRAYPEDDVTIYLDEKLGYKLLALHEELDAEGNAEKAKVIEGKIDQVSKELQRSKYVFHCHGISNEANDAIVDEVAESFPYEYDETTNPFTGEKTKTLIPNDDRTEAYVRKLWAACISSITDPDGAVDKEVGLETVAAFRQEGPLSGIGRVTAMLNKLRMATDWVEFLEDEDFLVKP